MKKIFDSDLVKDAQLNESFAQTAAVCFGDLNAARQVLLADHPGPEQQVSQSQSRKNGVLPLASIPTH